MNHSTDPICRGELLLRQPLRGYRFNVDSLLLAHFAGAHLGQPDAAHHIVDLGAGCGVVGLLLAARFPASTVQLVELQEELVELARQNIMLNGLQDRVSVACQDLRAPGPLTGGAPPDLVVSNPPFFRRGSGRPNADPQLALARHELTCTLEELARAGSRLLRGGGRFALVHAADRLDEALNLLPGAGLTPRLLRKIKPLPDREASRFLLLADADAGASLQEQEPLLVHTRPGEYSQEMKEVLGEEEPPGGAGGAEEA